MPGTDQRAAKVLDQMEVNIAVLDQAGEIVMVNRAWRRFARENPPAPGLSPRNTGVGANYLRICRDAARNGDQDAKVAHDGILGLIAGSKRHFTHIYPCHGPEVQRWFEMTARTLPHTKPREIMVAHRDVTQQIAAERYATQKRRSWESPWVSCNRWRSASGIRFLRPYPCWID